MNSTFYFWSGESKKDGVARTYSTRLKRIFDLAGIRGGHAHRLRDTFATELLLAGVHLERLSVLLGHSSIKVKEKHYAPGSGRGKNSWKQIYDEVGTAIRWWSLRRRGHQRYATLRRSSID
jgi:integrase